MKLETLIEELEAMYDNALERKAEFEKEEDWNNYTMCIGEASALSEVMRIVKDEILNE